MANALGIRVIVDGTEYRLSPDESAIIGREAGADIVVGGGPGASVSRRHARLSCTSEGWRLEDLGSTNGTWVDGRRVSSVLIKRQTAVDLGRQGGQDRLWAEPLADSAKASADQAYQHTEPTTLLLALIVGGTLLIFIGMFVLDWYRGDVSGPIQGNGTEKLELDGESLAVAAAAVGGILGLLGLRSSMPRPTMIALLLVTSVITAATSLYLMFGPDASDRVYVTPGATFRADVSLALGGFVTLAGALAVGVAGLRLAVPGSRRA